MDRGRKIKILEAIAAGNLSNIARTLPATYVTKFSDYKALQADVRVKYGSHARVFIHGGRTMVVTDQCGFWIIYEGEDGLFHDGGITYTATEYNRLSKELEASDELEWIELRPIVITYKRQPGNEPIIETEDII